MIPRWLTPEKLVSASSRRRPVGVDDAHLLDGPPREGRDDEAVAVNVALVPCTIFLVLVVAEALLEGLVGVVLVGGDVEESRRRKDVGGEQLRELVRHGFTPLRRGMGAAPRSESSSQVMP